jgi:hypothetical protein
MTVIYYSSVTGKPYQLALKVVDSCEVWVSTFHHTNERKITQRVGKWPVIREHSRK